MASGYVARILLGHWFLPLGRDPSVVSPTCLAPQSVMSISAVLHIACSLEVAYFQPVTLFRHRRTSQ